MAINNEEPRIVKTDEGNSNGQDKCPNCGATDISLNSNSGMLRCNFCRHEFEPEKVARIRWRYTRVRRTSCRVRSPKHCCRYK